MGYQLQTNPPYVTINSRTLAIGAFGFVNIAGNFPTFGIYEKTSSGEWNELINIARYSNLGDLIKDIQAKGGIVKFIAWLKGKLNAAFYALFGAAAPTPAPALVVEPEDDMQAIACIGAALAAMSLTVINGVPVLA